MAKVAGTAFFQIDGVQYSLRGNMTCSLGDTERESVVGLDQFHGYKEMPRASWIECDLTDRPEIDMNTIESLVDVTVTVILFNGKTGVLRNAVQINKLELKVEDGLYTVKFEGPKGEWIAEEAA
jgi:hypothetical protein